MKLPHQPERRNMKPIKKTVTAKMDTSEHKELVEEIRETLEEASALLDELASKSLEFKIEIN